MSEEAPKSIANRDLGPSTRMHVWNRPPLPKESPDPTKRTVTATSESPPVRDHGGARAHDPPARVSERLIAPRLRPRHGHQTRPAQSTRGQRTGSWAPSTVDPRVPSSARSSLLAAYCSFGQGEPEHCHAI